MNEYRCEMWIAHKYIFNVEAENIKEAEQKAKRITAEQKNEGEELVSFSIGELSESRIEGDCR